MMRKPPKPFKTWQEYLDARDSFYVSPAWHKLRQEVLKENEHRCVYCKRVPTKDNPVNIDHRVPLCKNWGLRLCKSNLQITCAQCNKMKGGMSHKRMLKLFGLLPKKKKKKQKISQKAVLRKQRQLEQQKRQNASFWASYLN